MAETSIPLSRAEFEEKFRASLVRITAALKEAARRREERRSGVDTP